MLSDASGGSEMQIRLGPTYLSFLNFRKKFPLRHFQQFFAVTPRYVTSTSFLMLTRQAWVPCYYHKAVESEYRFISCCPKYTILRKRFNLYQTWPSLEKINYIMKTKNKRKLINLMKDLKHAIILRNGELSVMQN